MAIKFKTVRYKNFLSTGNTFLEFPLDKHEKTIIIGKNGNGKSSAICAICFALFGRTFRNINKPQIVNSINKKDCVVELDFTIGTTDYTIRRGIKPNLFEIFANGELLNKPSDTRDYQTILEQQILGFNYKVFTQVVVLGSTSYVPFMKLAAAARREVVDEILSIKIFTIMSNLNKERQKVTKEVLKDIENKISNLRVKAEGQKKLIAVLQDKEANGKKYIEYKIAELDAKVKASQEKHEQLKLAIPETKPENTYLEQITKITSEGATVKYKLAEVKKTLSFYTSNDNCPTCSQYLQDKASHVAISKSQESAFQEELNDLVSKHNELSKLSSEIEKKIQQYNAAQTELALHLASQESLVRQLSEANTELLNLRSTANEIEAEKEIFKEIVAEGKTLSEEKNNISKDKDIQEIAALILKDSGIKTIAVKEYLPSINTLINKYLTDMDFFVKFELDEEFTETIKSRHRDVFTYMNFSEGERMRIDLAIMFAFRKVAKKKASLDTNLLFMDEILDGTLDDAGVDFVLDFISKEEDSNIFVISHKDPSLYDKFDSVIEFYKKGDFSSFEYYIK